MPHKDPEARKAYRRAYSQANKERIAERNKKWRADNIARIKEYLREYNERTKKERSEASKRWRQEHPDKVREYSEQKTVRTRERWHSDPEFRAARLEYCRQWRAANRDKTNAAAKRWRVNRPHVWKAKQERNKANAPSAQPEYARQRYATDPEYRARRILLTLKRRGRTLGAPGSFTRDDIAQIWDRQRHRCAVPNCTHPIAASGKNKYQIDHICALANGGTNWPDNLQLLCKHHNASKHTKDEYEWARSNGLLFIK